MDERYLIVLRVLVSVVCGVLVSCAAEHLSKPKLPLLQRPAGGFRSLGGMRKLKEQLRRQVLLPLRHPRLFFAKDEVAESVRPPTTHLFLGPPGTGKTSMAQALAAEARVPFLSVTLSSIEDKYFGETPKRLSAIFQLAYAHAPCILFFDELDGFCRHRSADESSATYGLKTELLRHMDEMVARRVPVVCIACTNHVHSIDAAMLRRFAVQHHFRPPTRRERERILWVLMGHEKPAESLIRNLARQTRGLTASALRDAYKKACASRIARYEGGLEHVADVQALVSAIGPLVESDWSVPAAEAWKKNALS